MIINIIIIEDYHYEVFRKIGMDYPRAPLKYSSPHPPPP